MPTTKTSKGVYVKVTNASSGERVVVRNITQGWVKELTVDSNAEVMYNPGDDDYTLTTSDVVVAEISGRINQVSSSTMTAAGGITFTLGDSADTTIANVSL